MGVLTGLRRVAPAVAERVVAAPDLVEALLAADTPDLGALGLTERPPHASMDGIWEEILKVLDGTGHRDAARALQDGPSSRTKRGCELRVISATTVKRAALSLAVVDPASLVSRTLESEITDYYGRPLHEGLAEHVASRIVALADFCRAASDADEAILVTTR